MLPGRKLRLSAAVLGLTLSLANGACAETIALADMLRGIRMSANECAAKPYTVWVTAYRQSICVRYYLSEAGGAGPRPVVFLAGDKLGVFDGRTQTFTPGADEKDVDTDMLMKDADGLSRTVGTTGIYLARIGVDGSSSHHGARRTLLELQIVNEALDAIKRRHRFEGFHLVGHSGGAVVVATLPALRGDVQCAVAGAGPLSARYRIEPQDSARRHLDPSEFIAAIAANPSARILVITDAADRRVPAELQTGFVRELRRAGREVDQFFVQAPDPQHHNVSEYSRMAAAECLRRTPSAEIAKKLAAYVQVMLARAAQGKAQQ